MLGKRFWLAFVAVYVVSQVLSFVIHSVWLDPLYAGLVGVFRSEEEMIPLTWVFFATSMVMVFFFCFIFTRGYENKGIGEGVRYGIYMGLFFMTVQAFDAYVVYPLPYGLILKWFLSGMVSFVVMGTVLAAVYRPAG
jgi:ABC-type multidrug transport system permease subunit